LLFWSPANPNLVNGVISDAHLWAAAPNFRTTLAQLTTARHQKIPLRFGFNALGDDFPLQLAGHGDQR